MARPRAVLPSSSSSSSDRDAGANAGTIFAVDAGTSAEKIDWDTSERISEARFWLFENLNKQRTKETISPRHPDRGARSFLLDSRLSSLQLC